MGYNNPDKATRIYRKTMCWLAINLYLDGGILYKKVFDNTFLRYLDKVIEEIHEGVYATHANRHMMSW